MSVIPETLDPGDFKNQPPRDRLCVKCERVPYKPQRSECCNTLYCQSCSEKQTDCPVHKRRQSYTDDKKLKTNIAGLKFKCPNWKTGCTFEETISKVYKQHLPECSQNRRSSMVIVHSQLRFLSEVHVH